MVWDRETGQPLHNAIVWLDNRTAGICHSLTEQLGSQDYFRPGGLWVILVGVGDQACGAARTAVHLRRWAATTHVLLAWAPPARRLPALGAHLPEDCLPLPHATHEPMPPPPVQ